jgi:lipid-binding SYLF domain-containing protein
VPYPVGKITGPARAARPNDRSKKMKRMPLTLIAALILGASTVAVAAEVKDYSSTIDVYRESPVVAEFFKNSYGYAVFPTIGRAGYIVGGSYGTGQVYRDGKVTGTSSVVEGSIGFQIGAEAFSEIIFFKDKAAYEQFTSGSFGFGANAQVVAVTAGAQAQAGTTGTGAGASAGPKTGVQAQAEYVNGMATFVHAKGGLMLEASVGGQKFTFKPL